MYRHGMDCENDNPETAGNEQSMMKSQDWVKYTLDLPMVEEPGKTSSYRSEEHTSELQSPVPISYAVFCLKKKKKK